MLKRLDLKVTLNYIKFKVKIAEAFQILYRL